MGSRILEIKGANQKDLDIRSDAFDALNELPTTVLKNLAEVSSKEKAVMYFSNPILFATVKAFLK